MKLAQQIKDFERVYSRSEPSVSVIERGTSRKGNRKLEVQVFSYELSLVTGTPDEYESWFSLVVDDDENILNLTQTV